MAVSANSAILYQENANARKVTPGRIAINVLMDILDIHGVENVIVTGLEQNLNTVIQTGCVPVMKLDNALARCYFLTK